MKKNPGEDACRAEAFLSEPVHGAGWPGFKVINCLSAFIPPRGIESNNKKDLVEPGILEFKFHSSKIIGRHGASLTVYQFSSMMLKMIKKVVRGPR